MVSDYEQKIQVHIVYPWSHTGLVSCANMVSPLGTHEASRHQGTAREGCLRHRTPDPKQGYHSKSHNTPDGSKGSIRQSSLSPGEGLAPAEAELLWVDLPLASMARKSGASRSYTQVERRGWRDGSVAKSAGCSCTDPELGSQHPY